MHIKRLVVYLFTTLTVISGLSLGLIGTTSQASAAKPYSGNPVGFADYCSQANGVTTIRGWAHDPQATAGASPSVVVKVSGQADQTVTSANANYRDTYINSYLTSRGIPTSSIYGWSVSYTGIYKGDAPTISGTIINVGKGTNSALSINTATTVDGDTSKAIFVGGKIPDSCLPVRPVAPVAHAPVPAGPFITATPNIAITSDSDSNYYPWLEQYGIPNLKAWYPAIADKIAQPDYVPATTLNIRVIPFNGVAYATGNTITISSSWLAANMNTSQGVLIHEAVHIIQNYTSPTPGWITEGIADNVRYYMFRDKGEIQPPKPTNNYTNGYSTSAYFLEYLSKEYGPNFIHDLNVSMHNNTTGQDISDSFILARTGKTYQTLWNEMMAELVIVTTTVVNGSGRCLDVSSSNFIHGAKVQLWDCNGSPAQKWNWHTNATTGTATVRINNNNHCLSISGDGVSIGTPVLLGNCLEGSTSQHWEQLGNNSLYNRASNSCVNTLNNGTGWGTGLVIAACDPASNTQRWVFQ